MKILVSLLATMIIAGMPMKSLGSDDILRRLWENDITSCEECAEIATGTYNRDGVEKPFLLLHESRNRKGGADNTRVRLEFERGDKYLIDSTFVPRQDAVLTRQLAVLYSQDPDKPRGVPHLLYEELGETNINPVFLTLSLYLVRKYTSEISHGEEVEAILKKDPNSDVNEMLRGVLPHKIYVRVEKRDGHVAPVEVQMYRDEIVICTIHIKNGPVSDRLRPFWMSFTAHGKTNEVLINSWGSVKNNHEYFTPTGLGRGELSIPQVFSRTMCPPDICNK